MPITYRPNEPTIDASSLNGRDMARVASAYQHMCSESSTDQVSFLVQRQLDGSRETPQRVVVDVEQGIVGDRWFHNEKRQLSEQVAMMNIHIATSIANGQSLTLFGDALL